MGKWSVFVQEMRYGSVVYMAAPTGPGSVPFMQNPGFITNLEVDYKILPQWTIGVGANNLETSIRPVFHVRLQTPSRDWRNMHPTRLMASTVECIM